MAAACIIYIAVISNTNNINAYNQKFYILSFRHQSPIHNINSRDSSAHRENKNISKCILNIIVCVLS